MDILNLGSGNKGLVPDDLPEGFVINVDKSLEREYMITDVVELENDHSGWDPSDNEPDTKTVNCGMDVFEFLDKYPGHFGYVASYRFFEHIGKFDLPFFLYQVANVMRKGAVLDIIVPDYLALANRVIREENILIESRDNGTLPREWENDDIITTTEIVNTPDMPHASIWTPQRALYYLELEKRFKVDKIEENCDFDGRDIYMRVFATRL